MITKESKSLSALKYEVSRLKLKIQNSPALYQLNLLFRGQSNASWELETTLERYTKKPFSVTDYDVILQKIHPEILSHTDKRWAIEKNFDYSQNRFSFPGIPNYSFMTYVRHHGFPSPLLDWSESMYVALFFAYQKAEPDKDIAIYTFNEPLSGLTGTCLSDPSIYSLGPYVESDKRHFMQQTHYTVCAIPENPATKRVNWHYRPHEKASKNCQDQDTDQPDLYKFTLPGKIKDKVLAELHEMNINAFTLFSSEESLMETLAYKEIILGKGLTRG